MNWISYEKMKDVKGKRISVPHPLEGEGEEEEEKEEERSVGKFIG